jgi:ATP-dependent RNA helicase DeaD
MAARADLDPVERFRALVREELQRVEPAAELLLLEPLLEEHGTVPVAAALASLLRRRSAGPVTEKQWPDMEADSGLTVGPLPTADEERGTRPAWTRIYVAVGRRDGAKANDLVGAITGEAGVVGGQIGKIEIRNSFTLVDIESQVVDDVIRGLDGASIRGRTVSVRLDREA